LITLLHNVLHHPSDLNAWSDLQRVEPLINVLAALAENKENKEVLRIHVFCVELRRRAMAALHLYEAQIEGYGGRNEMGYIGEGRDDPEALLADSLFWGSSSGPKATKNPDGQQLDTLEPEIYRSLSRYSDLECEIDPSYMT
jgi:hypothetical protein